MFCCFFEAIILGGDFFSGTAAIGFGVNSFLQPASISLAIEVKVLCLSVFGLTHVMIR